MEPPGTPGKCTKRTDSPAPLRRRGSLADSLHRHFGQVLNSSIFVENRGPYQTLKAQGLDLISSDSLRAQITALYEFHYQAVEEGDTFDRKYLYNRLLPYYQHHFREVELFQTAVPHNYEAVVTDPIFREMVAWRVDSKKKIIIPPYERAQRQAMALSEAVGRELDAH